MQNKHSLDELEKLRNKYFTYIESIIYYSGNKLSFLDLTELLTPKLMLEKLIKHLIEDKHFISIEFISYIKFFLKNSSFGININESNWNNLLETIDKIIKKFEIGLNLKNWKSKNNKNHAKSKKDYIKHISISYTVKLKKLKKEIFNDYDSSLFKKIKEFLKPKNFEKNDDNLLINIGRIVVSQLLFLGFSSKTINHLAKKSFYELKDVKSFNKMEDAISMFSLHFNPKKRINNKYSIAFPINEKFLKSDFKNKFYIENICKSFNKNDDHNILVKFINWIDLEKNIEIRNQSRNKLLDKKCNYLLFEGYKTFDKYNVVDESINKHIKWIHGYIKMVSGWNFIDLNKSLIVFQIKNKKYWYHSDFSISEYKDAEFIYPEGNISKLIENTKLIKNKNIINFIVDSMSLKTNQNHLYNLSQIINLYKIIEDLPLLHKINKNSSRANMIYNLTKISIIKSSILTYIKHNKNIFRHIDIDKNNKNIYSPSLIIKILSEVKEKKSKILEPIFLKFIEKSLNFLNDGNCLKNKIFFIIYASRWIRNENAHKYYGVNNNLFEKIIINSLDSLISVMLFDLIYISYEKFDEINQIKKKNYKSDIKEFLEKIKNYNDIKIKKYKEKKEIEDIINY